MEQLFITVIIPIYNGEESLPELLSSLVKQTLDNQAYEVLLIDNNSTDNTEKVIKEHIKNTNHKNLKYKFFGDKQGSYATRNFGIRQASGDILVFTDADCQPQADWLKGIYEFYNENWSINSIIAGEIEIVVDNPESLWENYDKLAHLNNEKYVAKNTGATANLAVPKQAFAEVGYFKEVFSGGDVEWTSRAANNGYNINYKPKIKVLHPARNSYEEIKKKTYRIAYGKGKKAADNNQNKFLLLIKYLLKVIYLRTNIVHSVKLFEKVGVLKVLIFNLAFFGLRFSQIKGVNDGYNDGLSKGEQI